MPDGDDARGDATLAASCDTLIRGSGSLVESSDVRATASPTNGGKEGMSSPDTTGIGKEGMSSPDTTGIGLLTEVGVVMKASGAACAAPCNGNGEDCRPRLPVRLSLTFGDAA